MTANNDNKPVFRLARINEAGSPGQNEIVMLNEGPGGGGMSRREFIGAGITAAAAVAFLSACGRGQNPPVRMVSSGEANRVGARAALLNAHKNGVNSVFISSDGKWLASGGADKTVKLWDLPAQLFVKKMEGHKGDVHSVIITPGGSDAIISGSADNTVKIWSLPDGDLRGTLEDHKRAGQTLCASPDGTILASGSGDGMVLLRTETGTKTLGRHRTRVVSICISPNGKWMASADASSEIKIWSLPSGALIETLDLGQRSSVFLCASPDSKLLVTAGHDKYIRLWRMPGGELAQMMRATTGFGNFSSVCMSPDGKLLAAGTSNATITLWNLPDGKLLKTLIGHMASVNSVCISPDGKLLASGSTDKSIRLWSLDDGGTFVSGLVDLADTPDSVKGVIFTVTRDNGQVVVYTLPVGATIPDGSTCACNSVAGGIVTPKRNTSGSGSSGGGCRHGGGGQRCVCMAVRCRRS